MLDRIEKVAEEWRVHTLRFGQESYDPDLSAFELDNLCHDDPELALQVILRIIMSVDSKDLSATSENDAKTLLSNLGAGPLEDLLVYHGTRVIDIIERSAREDKRVAWTLGNTWRNSIPREIWERVQKVSLLD